jgi:hypothetical protein
MMADALGCDPVDWSALKSIRPYTPLGQVAPRAEGVRQGLYRIGDGAYLLAGQVGPDFVVSPDAPLITSVAWAESDGAAIRSCTFETEADQGAPARRPSPPAEMLPLGVETFGDLRQVARERPVTGFGIGKSYRIAMDGRYMYYSIDLLHRYEFFYRGNPPEEAEKPMAISYRLSSARGQLAAT